jgi:hypothetical protein
VGPRRAAVRGPGQPALGAAKRGRVRRAAVGFAAAAGLARRPERQRCAARAQRHRARRHRVGRHLGNQQRRHTAPRWRFRGAAMAAHACGRAVCRGRLAGVPDAPGLASNQRQRLAGLRFRKRRVLPQQHRGEPYHLAQRAAVDPELRARHHRPQPPGRARREMAGRIPAAEGRHQPCPQLQPPLLQRPFLRRHGGRLHPRRVGPRAGQPRRRNRPRRPGQLPLHRPGLPHPALPRRAQRRPDRRRMGARRAGPGGAGRAALGPPPGPQRARPGVRRCGAVGHRGRRPAGVHRAPSLWRLLPRHRLRQPEQLHDRRPRPGARPLGVARGLRHHHPAAGRRRPAHPVADQRNHPRRLAAGAVRAGEGPARRPGGPARGADPRGGGGLPVRSQRRQHRADLDRQPLHRLAAQRQPAPPRPGR